MRLKTAGWIAIGLVAAFITLVIIATVGSRTETLRKLVVATLEDRLNSDVELRAFSVDTLPTPTIRGEGLVLRLRGVEPGEHVPPLIQIESFTVHCGIVDLLRRPRRFKHVALKGLVVNIPPGGLKHQFAPDSTEPAPAEVGKAPIIVETLHSEDALLRIIPRQPDKPPREFAIHSLKMESLGFGHQMPFTAKLTNPVPRGEIATTGTFGPWKKTDPAQTPVAGRYRFEKADLDTIDGIGGILNSIGEFSGELARIAVKGETETPDFHIDVGGQSVPLTTKFDATVDGTDGDTYLNAVNAQLARTSLFAKGAVTGTKGVKGRTVKLHVKISEGRIEDLLLLAVKSKKPLMVGSVALHTDFNLPPGESDVIDRLQLAGEFGVAKAQFTDPKVREKLIDMSRRARGLDREESKADNVVTDLRGRFRMARAVVTFNELAFSIPGATLALTGHFGLRREELSFDGTLTMQATVSEAAGGGIKGALLKLVDPIFRKKGAGAVIPIRIRGTAEKPEFGIDMGRVFKSK